ncbi:MAG TPA: hypothetical protein DD435_17510 [Cyanobacteria bacterium UBA8530]|nr:hypothetical protein [Cyanobacteria bacterium UBA8530]
MKRFFLAALLFLGGCAQNVTKIESPPVLLFSFTVRGSIALNPNVKYYLVLNASPNQSEGPTINGSYPYNRPNPGWDLPFYRDYDIDPGSSEPLRQTVWTDYYQLATEAGTPIMSHGSWPNPTETVRVPTIYTDVSRPQQGRDWDIRGGKTVTLTIPFSELKGSGLYDAKTGKVNLSSLNINLAISGINGAPIDFPTVSSNEYLTIPTREGITEASNVFPVKKPENIPSGVDSADVNFASYRLEVKKIAP